MPKMTGPKIHTTKNGEAWRRLTIRLSEAAYRAAETEAGVRLAEGDREGSAIWAVIESAVLATYGTPRAPEAGA